MFMYEKDNKLCVVFDEHRQIPAEEPDVVLWKDENGKVCLQLKGEEE